MVDVVTAPNQSYLPMIHDLNAYHGDLGTASQSSLNRGSSTTDVESQAFRRWRPQYHLMAPHGWMNDPCVVGYDQQNKRYHVGFEWNPKGHEWGNMSWGSATSPDLLNWKVSAKPSLEPKSTVDPGGVFTGCLLPATAQTGPEHQLTAFYTSANQLPIHHTLPYTYGSERLHAATSVDGGRTWSRHPANPLLPGPPKHLSVTGWRDPYITRWPALDALIGRRAGGLYGLIAGGIKNNTPTVFCYKIDANDMLTWHFLGALVDLGVGFEPSRWTGEFGRNFEVVSLATFEASNGELFDVIVTGVEGRRKDNLPSNRSDMVTDHSQMWFCCRLEDSPGGTKAAYRFGGTLDWGCLYATTVFRDPNTDGYVSFGWILEADLSEYLTAEQQWSGCLSIPRTVRLGELHHVVGTIKSNLQDVANVHTELHADGTFSIYTLEVAPHPNLVRLRQSAYVLDKVQNRCRLPSDGCDAWELKASFDVSGEKRYGFAMLHSEDGTSKTSVFFDAATETVVVDRSLSSGHTDVNRSAETAPHTLFKLGSASERCVTEELSFHVYYDKSVLEVFVNGRTVITTRVYPESGTCFEVSPLVLEDPHQVSEFDLWALKRGNDNAS